MSFFKSTLILILETVLILVLFSFLFFIDTDKSEVHSFETI